LQEQSKIVSGGVIAGYVIDPDRKPVGGASVMFSSGPGPLPDIAQVTDAQGAFALAAPTKGAYRLLIKAPGFAAVERIIELTDDAASPIEVSVGSQR
jgi:hypothetical protein